MFVAIWFIPIFFFLFVGVLMLMAALSVAALVVVEIATRVNVWWTTRSASRATQPEQEP